LFRALVLLLLLVRCAAARNTGIKSAHTRPNGMLLRTANIIQVKQDRSIDDDDDRVYSKAFEALLTQSISSLYVEPEPSVSSPSQTLATETRSHSPRQVSIEEIYNDEGVRLRYVLSLQSHILEEIKEDRRAEMDPTVNVNIPPPEAPAPELTQQIPPV
jgi:hypothetical protein